MEPPISWGPSGLLSVGVGQVWPLGPVPAGPVEWRFKGHFRGSAHLLSLIQLSLSESQAWGETGRNGSLQVARPWAVWVILSSQRPPKTLPYRPGPRMRTEWWSWLRDLRETRGQRVIGEGAAWDPSRPDLLSSHLGHPGSGTKAREPRITSAASREGGADPGKAFSVLRVLDEFET